MNIKEDNISSPRKKQHKKSTKSPVKDESQIQHLICKIC